jgi:hypothetical protein
MRVENRYHIIWWAVIAAGLTLFFEVIGNYGGNKEPVYRIPINVIRPLDELVKKGTWQTRIA